MLILFFTMDNFSLMTHCKTCKVLVVLLILASTGVAQTARAGYWEDGKAYLQAPLQWQKQEWLMFGGVLTLTALAYPSDPAIRDYMQANQGPLGNNLRNLGNSWGELTGLGGLTMLGLYGLGSYYDKPQWQRLGYQGFEAVVLSGATTAVLKHSFGRLRPYESTQHDQWFSGGQSFPSGHTTAAFALSTVLAEGGGNPSWQRRSFFYGLAGLTAYGRMYGNNHWLSDTVMGAAIGIYTGLWVVRHGGVSQQNKLLLYPTANGFGFIYVV
jgi:membrane-associated phospholipid phosphatase